MAYETVTSPILTDATGQDIVDKLDEIAQKLQPPTNIEASDVSYDNTQSGMTATDVQGAVTELKSNLTHKANYIEGITTSTNRLQGAGTYTATNDAWFRCVVNAGSAGATLSINDVTICYSPQNVRQTIVVPVKSGTVFKITQEASGSASGSAIIELS